MHNHMHIYRHIQYAHVNKELYLFIGPLYCVCASVHACVRACMHACVHSNIISDYDSSCIAARSKVADENITVYCITKRNPEQWPDVAIEISSKRKG